MIAARPLAALFIALSAAGALATSFAATTVDELLPFADVVVRARVVSSSSRALESGRIVTFHDAHVLEVVRGALAGDEVARGRLLVGVPGGVVGDVGQRVPGAPLLEVGREYVLLLGARGGPGGARGIPGLMYGALPAGPDLDAAARARLDDALARLRPAR